MDVVERWTDWRNRAPSPPDSEASTLCDVTPRAKSAASLASSAKLYDMTIPTIRHDQELTRHLDRFAPPRPSPLRLRSAPTAPDEPPATTLT